MHFKANDVMFPSGLYRGIATHDGQKLGKKARYTFDLIERALMISPRARNSSLL